MLPRLQAEETLDLSLAAALGAGTLNATEAKRLARELARRAGAEPARAAKADAPALAAMGIGVEVISARDDSAGDGDAPSTVED